MVPQTMRVRVLLMRGRRYLRKGCRVG